jgi:hypothetical protein
MRQQVALKCQHIFNRLHGIACQNTKPPDLHGSDCSDCGRVMTPCSLVGVSEEHVTPVLKVQVYMGRNWLGYTGRMQEG